MLNDVSAGMPSNVPSFVTLGQERQDGSDAEETTGTVSITQMDKDFLCPICMQRMNDAFLTSCGHSFCYSCVKTHLGNRQNCPCCGQFLTHDQLFPNFLLNKLLKKAAYSQQASRSSPAESLRLALLQGEDVSLKELESLLSLISEKKKKAEQEEAEANMEILLDFLHRSARQKQRELEELKASLKFLEEDISTVVKRRRNLGRIREESNVKLKRLLEQCSPSGRADFEFQDGEGTTGKSGVSELGSGPSRRRNGKQLRMKSERSDVDLRESEGIASAAAAAVLAKKSRVFSQFEDLQECYMQCRKKAAAEKAQIKNEENPQENQVRRRGLDDFQNILNAYTKYSRLKIVAELRHGDLFHSSNIVSSIEFDRDDELFATAGVSRRIKVFEYNTVVNEMADVHCPVVEMSTRSKLSCLSWNKYEKSRIASSDYEGIVTVWDVKTCQSVMEYEEHEKRAWSVDFSRTEPTRLVSGSDDGKVKIWCTRQETSVINIDMKANICCVKFNPGSSNYVAVGSADHHIHYYDVRQISAPLHVFSGHRKAVSYVKFISSTELASASTDSTLRLWDVQRNCALRTLKGHTNEKNFVGLSVNEEYIACGSETNEVYVYYKEMSKPSTVHKFGSPDNVTGEDSDDDTSHFISAVCWKSNGPTMLAANSQGTIKVLSLAP